jgi:hypothetical protein
MQVTPNDCHHVTLSPSLDTALVHATLTATLDACEQAQCLSASPPEACSDFNCTALAPHARQVAAMLPNRGFPIVNAEGRMDEWYRALKGMHAYADIDPGHRCVHTAESNRLSFNLCLVIKANVNSCLSEASFLRSAPMLALSFADASSAFCRLRFPQPCVSLPGACHTYVYLFAPRL